MIALPECQPADDARIAILHIGDERSPVIRIDGATTRPGELVRYACEAGGFALVDDSLYPGWRAPMPLDFVRAMVMRLDPLIRRTFALGDERLAGAECFFSMVTTPAAELKPFQTVPHIDTTDPLHFATVHYLCAEDFGGTAFFRQDETGFESITPEREGLWGAARDRQLAGGAPLAYPSPATAGYTRIAVCATAFDRLVLYRSNALHSGVISSEREHVPDPRKGRLTATTFIRYRSR